MVWVMMAVVVVVCVAGASWAAGEGPGALSVCDANPRYLAYRGKPVLLVSSAEHYGAVMNLDFDWRAYLDEMAACGCNQTRVFSGTYREYPGFFGIVQNTLAPERYIGPWARSDKDGNIDGGKKFDLEKFDETYFARLRDYVAEAQKRGVMIEYVLFCTFYKDELWDQSPMNSRNNVNGIGAGSKDEVYTMQHKKLQAAQDAFVRKAVAELAEFDNVYYEICNEPYSRNLPEAWQRHIAAVVADAEKDLPAPHLIAQGIANLSAKVTDVSEHVSILNFHYATPPIVVGENYALGKVIADDETGIRDNHLDATYRREGWEFMLAGGGVYSSLDYSFAVGHERGDFAGYNSPGGGSRALRQQLTILRRFLEGFDFVHMRPAHELVKKCAAPEGEGERKAWLLAAPGKAYAAYVFGGKVKLGVELPAGTYRAEWVSPLTGDVVAHESVEHAGGVRMMAYEGAGEDVALRVLRV